MSAIKTTENSPLVLSPYGEYMAMYSPVFGIIWFVQDVLQGIYAIPDGLLELLGKQLDYYVVLKTLTLSYILVISDYICYKLGTALSK